MKTAEDYLREQEVHQVYIGGIVYEMVKLHQAVKASENFAKQEETKLESPTIHTFPEWLTDDIREKAKQTWNEHKNVDDHKRIEAMRIVQRAAEDVEYKIGIKKATEILYKYCL